jgi:glycosyltransferase involved in cell wall biosynthesis
MRIALITHDASSLGQTPSAPSGEFGGCGDQGTRVTSLAQALAREGHRVTIYGRQDSRGRQASSILAPGVIVEQVPAGPAKPLAADKLTPYLGEFGSHLAQRWRRNRPDVVHAHYWTGGVAALAATRDLGIPVLQAFESLATAERRLQLAGSESAPRVRLETAIARSTLAILARSSQEMSDLARLGVSRASIRVLPCGVDTATFSPDGPAARRGKQPRLLAISTLAGPHGIDTALRALPGVPDAELVIAGGPADAEGADNKLVKSRARRELDKLAAKMGVRDRVTFAGPVSQRDLPRLLRSADILVSPAWYEPIGATAIQAMACGVPVVASAVGSHRDAVVDGTTGALVSPGRPDLLARRLRELLSMPVRLEALGIAAADRARARYSWERIGRETLMAYRNCLEVAAASRTASPGRAAQAQGSA